MKYILGSPKEFYDFVDSIKSDDYVGIFSHTDVDGLASSIFLTKILEAKKIKVEVIDFFNYEKDILKKKIIGKNCNKLFLTDWNADQYPEDLDYLRTKADILVIDHHPLNESLNNKKGVIKTESSYCSAHTIFDLGKKYLKTRNFEELLYASLIYDYTISDERIIKIMNKHYPGVEKHNAHDSGPGIFGRKINAALTYFFPDVRKVYDLFMRGDFEEFDKADKVLFNEANYWKQKYMDEAEFIQDKNVYFFYANPKFSISSGIVSQLSYKNPHEIFIFVSDIKEERGYVKMSSRAQSGKINLGEVLKEISKELEDSVMGGHVKAAGGSFKKKDLMKFRKLFLERI